MNAEHPMGSAAHEPGTTVDQSDIRGLATACQRIIVGLPLSDSRRPSRGRSRNPNEDSPDRAGVSRCPSGAQLERVACGGRQGVSGGVIHQTSRLPQEGGEFARDSHADLVGMHAPCGQATVAGAQAQLRAPGDLADAARLALLALGDWPAHACRVAVAPRSLHQHAAHVGVAGLGDAALRAGRAAAEFAGYQPKVGHQLLGMLEAVQVTQLRHERGGSHEVDPLEAHQGLHHFAQAPVQNLLAQRLRDAIDPLACLQHRTAVLGPGDLLAG